MHVMLLDRPGNPTPDKDFFFPEVENNTYTASRRYVTFILYSLFFIESALS